MYGWFDLLYEYYKAIKFFSIVRMSRIGLLMAELCRYREFGVECVTYIATIAIIILELLFIVRIQIRI